MARQEGPSFSHKIRDFVAASVLIPTAAFGPIGETNAVANYSDSIVQDVNHVLADESPSMEVNKGLSLVDQLDQYLETAWGRSLASELLVGSFAYFLLIRKISPEVDSRNKERLARFSSATFVSLTAALFAESFTDVKPEISASLIEAFVISTSTYNIWTVFERSRALQKRVPSMLFNFAVVSAGTTLLVEAINK